MASCPDERLFAVQPEASEFTSAEFHPLSLPTSFVVAKRRQRVAAGVSPQIMMVRTVLSREAAAAGR